MKKLFLIPALAMVLGGCFEEEPAVTIEPETMADCIAIKNPNDRDICEMKLNEKMKQKRIESLGDGELPDLDW